MMLRAARIMVISGIALFGLRGVIGVMDPSEMPEAILLLLGGAAALEWLCSADGRCRIGELACREGLLSEDRVAHILSLQRRSGGHFGEIAVRENYLSPDQLTKLLDLQVV